MVKEADFYSVEEAAKVLSMPVRQVFGMLCRGELEGHQDKWARWLVPVSAVEHTRRNLKPSDPDWATREDDMKHHATQVEACYGDAEVTIILPAGQPLWKPAPIGSGLSSGETTQEDDEVPRGDVPERDVRTVNGDAKTTEMLSNDNYSETAVPGEAPEVALREIIERLGAVTEKTRQLRDRLEILETTEAALRESLKRACERADRERTRVGRTEEELKTKRNEGFWRRLFSE